ncbi:hypothetical protein AX289_24640 [Methylorubrum populi]|nr:hypothetical protein AX289_24640 [Methylorubrum populi]
MARLHDVEFGLSPIESGMHPTRGGADEVLLTKIVKRTTLKEMPIVGCHPVSIRLLLRPFCSF